MSAVFLHEILCLHVIRPADNLGPLEKDHQGGRAGPAAGWAADVWLEVAFEASGAALHLSLLFCKTETSQAFLKGSWLDTVWEEPGMVTISS